MSETAQMENSGDRTASVSAGCTPPPQDTRLTSRLCYLLRFGAVKEGLQVCEAGFVRLSELMAHRLMRHHKEQEILHEIDTSPSKGRGSLRFERKEKDGVIYVRARFARRFERNPYHPGTKVPTLLEAGIQYICANIDLYDFRDFPDEYIINSILHRLKREKRLNGGALRSLVSRSLEHLDLEGVYLTEGVIKYITRTCHLLRVISLFDCGYVMNDHLLEQTLRKLPRLESVNLAGCSHLTDRSVRAITKHCPQLKHLNISMIKGISESAVLELIERSPNLQHLDIFDHRISTDGRQKILELAASRGLTVVHRWLKDPRVAPPDPSLLLPNFGKVWY